MRLAIASLLLGAATLTAQEANPTQRLEPAPASGSPLYHVDVVARTTQAVSYAHRSAPTKIDFAGTILQPQAKVEARIDVKRGAVEVKAKFKNLAQPQSFGRQYLTYVLWAITPQGSSLKWSHCPRK